ncbi:hypothetical protein [uncultured Rhodoblastus sp.]|uniref:DUF3024 domain-containing protein n=1 Tax=uncultured Rhodoblastus sp. TaxID=543037 RepID=UPI0025FE28C0|nr:hypothetical protein [uncultured Rhodoblastus sp.]
MRGFQGRRSMGDRVWMNAIKKSRQPKPSETAKRDIIAACEAFIRDVLKPRFLPEIRPTEFNYCVDIFGEWRAGRYRFMQRYRSDAPNRIRDEFDAPFVRIDYIGPDHFDIYWMRHNNHWHPVFQGVALKQAFELMIDVPTLHPL